ncbi:hypothetical protein [Streptomyces sp. HNM0575]|uniref:hypothetical protein n=1 Tax=Streptomyces sp. HNM0575 TaxID=2716338 RepID=UPI0019D270CD|nr:hypothetical protein [Streptomyces sp. HNM0575]
MRHDATYRSAPPPPLPKRRNAVLRLYDAPLYRDWAFWNTVGWALLAGISIPATPPTEPSPLPRWLDTLLAIVMMVATFGVVPAWIRLPVRRWRWRRHERQLRETAASQGARAGDAAAPDSTAESRTERQAERPQAEPEPEPGSGRGPGAERPESRSAAPDSRQWSVPSQSARRPVWRSETETGTEGSDPRGNPRDGAERPASSAQLLTHARNALPHPAARAVRMLQQAHTPKDRYEALLDAAETLAITVSVTAAALLQGRVENLPKGRREGHESGLRNLSVLRNAYFGRGATYGTWTTFLRDLQPPAAAHPDWMARLHDALKDEPGGAQGILGHLDALRDERNRAAHGNKPKSQPESAARVAECAPHVESVLEKARFIEDVPWLYTISCVYQRRSRSFDIVADYAMGDHPDFERRTFTWDRPVGNEIFYALGPDGPVPLSPFVAGLFCPQCHQVEVCYAYKVVRGKVVQGNVRGKGTAVFKSFGRGHEIEAPEMTDELRSLPELRKAR